jgi:predicted RNA binding protein YcfA (HicA-like mRNA interferase family)
MNSGLPVVDGRRVLRALQRAGFVIDRVVGSHHLLVHKDDRRLLVTVPVHGARDLKPGTLRSIIRQAGMTIDEFRALL